MRRAVIISLVLSLLLVLTGCVSRNIDDLYSLPQLPESHTQLQSLISAEMHAGSEYSAPIEGYRRSVQFYDVDGDGTDEAFVFFRGSDQLLRVCIYRQLDADYILAAAVESEGTAIGRVEYADLDGDGSTELIVAWQMSPALRMVRVYSLRNFDVSVLLTSNCRDFIIMDMDGNGRVDLLVLKHDGAEANSVDMFRFDGSGETVVSAAPLSVGLESVEKLRSTTLADGQAALIVEGSFDGGKQIISDIFCFKNNTLQNITRSIASENSDITTRHKQSDNVYSQDIDGDRQLDIPAAVRLPSQSENSAVYWVLDWYCFDSAGHRIYRCSTYHSGDGWYINLPPEWRENLSVRREDLVAGERVVVLSRLIPETGEFLDILTVYTLTGENRRERARLPDRMILDEEETTIFAAKLGEGNVNWSGALAPEDIVARFSPIRPEWYNGSLY